MMKSNENSEDSDDSSIGSFDLMNLVRSKERKLEDPYQNQNTSDSSNFDEAQNAQFMNFMRSLVDVPKCSSDLKDEHDLFGERIALKLRNIPDPAKRFIVEQKIESILHEEELQQNQFIKKEQQL